MHLSPELYRLVLQGEITAETFVRAIHSHLVDTCEDCRKSWQAQGAPSPDLIPDLPMVRSLSLPARPEHASGSQVQAQQEWLREVRKSRRKARRDLQVLLATPAEERRRRIENARSRFRSPAFAQLLLEESRRLVRNDPTTAGQLASLVQVVLHWMPRNPDAEWASMTAIRGQALEANALRVAGNLRAAGRQFDELHRQMRKSPVLDSSVLAELASLEASLRVDQRRFDEAGDLLDRALVHFGLVGDAHGVARVRIQQGSTFLITHCFENALDCYREAAADLDPATHGFLYQCTVTGQVTALCEMGRAEKAADFLAANRDLYAADGDAYGQCQVRAMEALIASGLERFDEAELAYAECRDGYMALGRMHDAALSTLDLAQTLLLQGKTTQLRRMVVEVLEVFRSQDVSHGVLSAILLLKRSVVADTLTAALLAEARERVERDAR